MTWIEEFTNMLFPVNVKELNIEGAYMLKHGHLPKSIFKYRAVNQYSLQNLEEDTIWLADPKSFNDPYDCAHTFDYEFIAKSRDHEYIKNFLDSEHNNLSLSKIKQNEILQSHEPLKALFDYLLKDEEAEKKEGIELVFLEIQKKMSEDFIKTSSISFSSSFKLCSFSEINDSLLMWAHYADYHKGFCIEYDIENIPYSDYRRRFLYPVIYSDSMFDATEHFMQDAKSENFNSLHLIKAGLVKAKDWTYEKEWRLIFSSGTLAQEQSYYMGKPKAVFLGTRISESNQEKLVQICERKKIPLYKMKSDTNKFLLEATTLQDAKQHFFNTNKKVPTS
ncbi:DUF2971 domain-containing protein [Sulfurimonas sp.]|uniref:DUF2971 domain-containing protein n=1 Tax=Sulfurimonas sp. TaxID=2022749 RepID=UPI003D0EC61D